MEEELMELLKKLETQIDGVEAYYRQLKEFGDRPEFRKQPYITLGSRIRVESGMSIELSIQYMREGLQRIEDQMNLTCW